jgi:hypothetical protein
MEPDVHQLLRKIRHWSLSWVYSLSENISLSFILLFNVHLRPGIPSDFFGSGFL